MVRDSRRSPKLHLIVSRGEWRRAFMSFYCLNWLLIILSINNNNRKSFGQQQKTDSSPTVDVWLVTGLDRVEKLEMHFYWKASLSWLPSWTDDGRPSMLWTLVGVINWEESICGGKLAWPGSQHTHTVWWFLWATTAEVPGTGLDWELIELDSREIK